MDLPSSYQQFIHKSRYSRWREDYKRRETWEETVGRYIDYMVSKFGHVEGVKEKLVGEVQPAILNLEVMPSMRALMTAGPALDRCNIAEQQL